MIIKGDINGDGRITYLDLMILQMAMVGNITLTGDSFSAADINGDGELSLIDVARIHKHLSGEQIINEVIY